jgi:uncharacterized protein YndB with AHSA1/START domain
MNSSVQTDIFLPHPIESVWAALTDGDLLAAWLMPNDFEPREGHRFTFRTTPIPQADFDGVVHCEVLRLDPPHELRISWRSGDRLDTTVTWRLVTEGQGTRLFLSHDGFDEDDPWQKQAMNELGGGWRGHLAARLHEMLSATSGNSALPRHQG